MPTPIPAPKLGLELCSCSAAPPLDLDAASVPQDWLVVAAVDDELVAVGMPLPAV